MAKKCTICGKPVVLTPSAADRAAKDVQISNAARGKYPQSRSCVVHINDDAGKICWEARGAADTWIPKPLVADYIRAAVRDAENKSKHITVKNNAD